MGIVTKTVRTVKTSTTKTIRIVRTVKVTERNMKPQGLILYRGPSLITGEPIVVVAVGFARKSTNLKTGNMIQTYILSDGPDDPMAAVKTGADKAVCGDCPHRGTTCYVNVVQAPLAIYRAVQRGVYPRFDPTLHLHLFDRRHVRRGSYGDPAAVPIRVWQLVCSVADGHTGYTHQWGVCDPSYARYCMASVETPRQRQEAIAKGYRTFRVRLADQPVEAGEFVCPASEEAGKRLSCDECRACSGAKEGGKNASPTIVFHGPDIAGNWRYRHFTRTMERLQADESRRVALPTLN